MASHRAVLPMVLGMALAGCATARTETCLSGQQAAVQQLIYFGADTPSGRVTPEAFSRFLAETVTPKFPQGFTTWQASGQWRSASGDIVREPAYVLSVVHPQGAAQDAAIREIVATYKTKYQQEAVLQVQTNICMAL